MKLEKVKSSPKESPQKELEQFAKLWEQRRITLGYARADEGLTLGSSLWKGVQSDHHLQILQLSFQNVCKLRPLLENRVEKADNEKLQEIWKAEILVQANNRKQMSTENT
ncbi:hypothetical protein STEG23_019104 [Scotinomys teguina]